MNQASGIAGPGTKVTPVRRQSMANPFDQTPEEPLPVWIPVPPVFEEKPKPNDDGAGGYGLPPQIQNRPLRCVQPRNRGSPREHTASGKALVDLKP
jgi:hypothetical protein